MLFAACTSDTADPDTFYYGDIEPIVERSCVGCHVEKGTAPFPLDTYDAAYAVRELARDRVSTRTMPPWFASKECTDYDGDISLTDDEIALFERWVDQGAAEGNPTNAMPSDTGGPDEYEGIGHIDVTLEMAAPYAPTSTDEVRCFNLPWPMNDPTFITGIGIKTGDDSIMHHITLHSIDADHAAAYQKLEDAEPDEGYVCADSSGANDEGTVEIGGWAGGPKVTKFPEGSGMAISPGSLVQLQIHYTPTPDEVGVKSDQTSLVFAVDPNAKQAYLEIVVDGQMQTMKTMVPANSADVFLEGDVPPSKELPDSFWVTAVTFHMHYLGIGGGISIKHPDDTEDCLLSLTGWDPEWQQPYSLTEMKLFGSGDVWHIECEWDNSQENQPVIGGVQRQTSDIAWGTSLDQEMCRGSLRIVDATK